MPTTAKISNNPWPLRCCCISALLALSVFLVVKYVQAETPLTLLLGLIAFLSLIGWVIFANLLHDLGRVERGGTVRGVAATLLIFRRLHWVHRRRVAIRMPRHRR